MIFKFSFTDFIDSEEIDERKKQRKCNGEDSNWYKNMEQQLTRLFQVMMRMAIQR